MPRQRTHKGRVRVLSLGAGVQSTCLLLMSLDGAIEPYDFAVFADTGWEPKAVYDHLDNLKEIARSKGMEIAIVSAGNIRDDTMATVSQVKTGYVTLPLYARKPGGQKVMLSRTCTRKYKVAPVRRYIHTVKDDRFVELHMGISYDELTRMKQSPVMYIEHVYPLVDMKMTREDCLTWLENKGYARPPKSSCIACPFHSSSVWREVKKNEEEWQDAIAFDRAIRVLPRVEGEAFVHRLAIPLEEVDLSTEEDRGQLNMFDMECEGMCGV